MAHEQAGVVMSGRSSPHSLASAGYTLLCSEGHDYANPVLLDFLNRGRHETRTFGNTIGIRCRDSNPVDFQCPWVSVNSENLHALRLSSAVERFRHSYFGQYYYDNHPSLNAWDEVADASTHLPKADPSPFDWELLARLLSRCESKDLLKCIEEIALPVFFRWNPSGCLQIYLQDYLSEKYFAEMRILRIVSTLKIDEGQESAPQSLAEWQSTNPLTMFELLLEWCGSITYPVIQNYIIGPLGLTLNFTDDTIAVNIPPSYPSSFSDIKHSKSGFGVFTPPLEYEGDLIHAPAETHHGRAVWDEEVAEAATIQSWFAKKAHSLISELTNLSNYSGSSVTGSGIDLSMPFEQTATIDRMFRRALWLNTADQRSISRLPVFEIADSIAAIKFRWTNKKERHLFKQLFSIVYLESALLPALRQVPDPWAARLESIARRSYEEVHRTILESVWSDQRVLSSAVDISRLGDQSELSNFDDFVTSTIRDLRNTHHGYLPDRRFSQIRRRLSLVSGRISPQISLFPTIWLLAMMIDPKTVLGWDVRFE